MSPFVNLVFCFGFLFTKNANRQWQNLGRGKKRGRMMCVCVCVFAVVLVVFHCIRNPAMFCTFFFRMKPEISHFNLAFFLSIPQSQFTDHVMHATYTTSVVSFIPFSSLKGSSVFVLVRDAFVMWVRVYTNIHFHMFISMQMNAFMSHLNTVRTCQMLIVHCHFVVFTQITQQQSNTYDKKCTSTARNM